MDTINPNEIDKVEEVVLGAIILEQESLHEVVDLLHPDMFTHVKSNAIAKTILELYDAKTHIDIVTLYNQIKTKKRTDIVSAHDLSKLTNNVASSAHLVSHVQILHQRFIKARISLMSTKLHNKAQELDQDSIDLIIEAEKQLSEINDLISKTKFTSTEELYNKLKENNQKIRDNPSAIIGVNTGFDAINVLTGGFQKSDMIILAARPGMGKTSLALNLAANAAVDFKQPTVVFSLEMSNTQLLARIISQKSGIAIEDIIRTGMDDQQVSRFEQFGQSIYSSPIFIEDTPAMTINDFRAKAARYKREHDIELIVIDYLQLMKAGQKTHSQEHEVAEISKAIKQTAKELDLPIIALSQLSREVEKRGGKKKPGLSDLRYSGAIEQDADIIMFLYRPEYYGITHDENGYTTEGLAELDFAKHRNGSIASIDLKFDAKTTNFKSLNHF